LGKIKKDTIKNKIERISGFNGAPDDHLEITWSLTDDGGE